MHDVTSGEAGVERDDDETPYEEPVRTREQEALLSLLRAADLANNTALEQTCLLIEKLAGSRNS